MRAKDVRTLESLLKELYPNYNKGVQGNAGMASPSIANTKPVSPTMSKGAQAAKPVSNVKVKTAPAGNLQRGDKIINPNTGQEDAEVVSPVGAQPITKKPVVKTPDGKLVTLDPSANVVAQESSVSSIISKPLSKIVKSKHLIRKLKLKEQGPEQIFEINFNSKNLAVQALDLNINCGFEAETSWNNMYDSDDDGDFLDELSWYEIEDLIVDQAGRGDRDSVIQAYDEWIFDKALDLSNEINERMVSEREEDEYYLNAYIDKELSESDIEDYKEEKLGDLEAAKDDGDESAAEEFEERSDWDISAWGREYVEENLLDEYREWLAEDIRDNGEDIDEALEDTRDQYDMDRWVNSEYGSWASCLSDQGIYLYPEGQSGGMDEIAQMLELWTEDNSSANDVRSGDYHANAGTNNKFWRVEPDSSIESSGVGAEIISPVYKTPKDMLAEMKGLFDWLKENDVETNRSTGLHVTMSVNNADATSKEVNAVKLAVLLGDKYLLSTFGRTGNSYAKSQMDSLEKLAQQIKSNPDVRAIKEIEDILNSGVSRDKFSSINFKGQRDRNTDRQLIEFRIGGGSNYHLNFPTIVKAVIRYAVVLQSAYNDNDFTNDYAKALYRLIHRVGKIDPDAEATVKDRLNAGAEHPAYDVLKDYFSKDTYLDAMRTLAASFNNLADYHSRKSVTNEAPETEQDLDNRYTQALLNNAQDQFAKAIAQAGYDYSQGYNRAVPNAKSIGVLRSALKDFDLDYDKLGELITANQDTVNTNDRRSNLTPKIILGRIKNGVDKLFKKSVVQEPEYLTASQVDKITQGMWNAIQSDEIKDSQEAIKFANLLADASGKSPDSAAAWVDEVRSQSANREFKEFHAKVQRGSYGTRGLFTAGEPVDSKKLKALMDYLKQYPEWDHPVAKGHNPNITGDDSYIDNALSKMMIKMRSRWEHLEDIRQDNPGLYIDSIREIAKLVTALVDANKTTEHEMGDKHKDLLGTAHAHHRDGHQYFGMPERIADKLLNLVNGIEQPNTRMVWDDPVAYQLRDSIQNYIRSAYTRYYEMKSREGDGFYRLGSVPEIIKQRTDAIKEFLTGFDKVAQKLGFDSQSSEIANKKQLDQKQADFKKKHGPEHLGTIDAFSFGGDIFVSKNLIDQIDRLDDTDLAKTVRFSSSIHKSDTRDILVIPSAHYFTALDAEKVLENPRYKNTWREPLAITLLAKFENLYSIKFKELSGYYANINDGRIKRELLRRNINITDKLGDGRIGMGMFAPLLPNDQLQSPHGEPFSPSAATAWKVNNPELAKKAEIDDTNATGAPSHLRGLNDFGKARIKFKEFDYMMQNGINEYVKDSEKQDLVAFLNGNDVDKAVQQRMLKIMIDNVDQQLKEPMGISQALVRAQSQRENMNTFDKFNNLPLEEQLRILAKVDKKKIDEAWSKKYKDSINCSDPKGFSQKAHCDGKKKKTNERKKSLKNPKDNPCWDGYKPVGTKKKNGKTVPNCVPETIEAEQDMAALLTAYGTPKKKKKKKVKEGAVPDNRTVTILNKLFAEKMPANDLRKQMDAYIAIPDPSMIKDFRMHRSAYGESSCLRGILRRYVEAQLDPSLKSKVNLNEWYSGTIKKLLNESSRGIIGTVLDNNAGRGDSFVDDKGVQYTPVNAYKFPVENEQAKYDAIDENGDPVNPDTEFADELMMLLNLPASSVTWCGGQKASTGYAVLIVELDSSDNNKIFVGKYFRSKDASGHLFWQVSKFLQDVNAKGIKLALKRGENRTGTHGAISLFPSNLGITGNLLPIDKVPAVIQESMKKVNLLDDSQQAVINSLVAGLTTGQPSQITPEYAANYEVQLGETVTPIALNKGIHVSGSYTEAEQTLLSVLEPGLTWRGMTSVEYPSDIAEKLIDSYMYSPKGTKVGVSSKDKKGGAPASITGIIETLENRYDVILDRVPDFGKRYRKYLDYLKVIKSSTGLQQPINLAVHLGIITPDVAMQAEEVIYKRPGDAQALKAIDGGKFYNLTVGYEGYAPKAHPLYQVGYHALASLARIVQNKMNEDVVDISRFFSTILESSNMVQVKTGFKASGDQGAFDSFYVIYPPVFKGTITFDCGSYYYATKKPTGGFTFKFKGSRGQ